MATIGDRIKYRREQLGLSQDSLAQCLGYKSRSSINKIESNQRNLTQSKIKAIADALETTPSYIMGWDDELTSGSTDKTPISVTRNGRTQEVIDLIENLPESKKQEALNYVRYLSENADK